MLVRDTKKYMKFDLGKLAFGRQVEVTLSGSVANVRLLNGTNLFNYERSREYEFTGGLMKEPVSKFHVPNTDRWYIVVDTKGLEGLEGQVKASVKVL